MAFNWEHAGSSLAVLPIDDCGRKSKNMPLLHGHTDTVTDLHFSPFHDGLLATASQDCLVSIFLHMTGKRPMLNVVLPCVAGQNLVHSRERPGTIADHGRMPVFAQTTARRNGGLPSDRRLFVAFNSRWQRKSMGFNGAKGGVQQQRASRYHSIVELETRRHTIDNQLQR